MGFGLFKKRKTTSPDEPAPQALPALPDSAAPKLRVYTMGPSQERRYTVELLAGKSLDFEEIDVSTQTALQSWVLKKTGSREYPQVFRDEVPLGDFAALRQLDLQGNLDRLLAGQAPLAVADESEGVEGEGARAVVARLRRGDVISLTTPDGETFDTWAEVYANPPQVYYRGEPRPLQDLDSIAAEIAVLVSDERTEVAWSHGK